MDGVPTAVPAATPGGAGDAGHHPGPVLRAGRPRHGRHPRKAARAAGAATAAPPARRGVRRRLPAPSRAFGRGALHEPRLPGPHAPAGPAFTSAPPPPLPANPS